MLVAVMTPDALEPRWVRALQDDGVRVELVRLSPRAYFRERREVRRLVAEFRADIVHTHGYRSDVLHVGMAGGLGLPAVTTAHGFASSDLKGTLYERVQRHAWRRFDAVVAVSSTLVDRILAAGVLPSRVIEIRNGPVAGSDKAGAAEARLSLGLPLAGSVVGWVGRLSEEKDPLLAIEAIAHLGDVSLCLVGAGPLLSSCERKARELGVEGRVRIVGAVAGAASLFTAFDTLLLSSRTEGTPMVALEAAAAGVPVVSTAVGGVPDLVGQGAGWLAPSGDALALAAAIRESLDDRAESARRVARMQDRLTTKRGEADWVDQYLELYARLVSANPSGRA